MSDREGAREEARRLVEEGLTVVPAHPTEKFPVVPWKRYQEKPPSEDEVNHWLTTQKYSGCNWAILTGVQVVAVDTDSEEATVFWETYATHTPRRTITAKGKHFFYQVNPNFEVRNSVNPKMKIDLRGTGGCVIAPGSIHETGHVYCRDEDPGVDTWWQELPMLTAKDIRLIEGFNTPKPTEVKQGFSVYDAGVEPGGRNSNLASAAGTAYKYGASIELTAELLRKRNSWNREPLDDAEVESVAVNMAGTHQRGLARAEAELAKQQEEQPKSLQPKPFVLGDPAQLPARQFVWGHAYPRGVVSVTVAPGGLGKSTIITAEAVAMTTGHALLGRQTEPRKCWLWNLEDPIDEIYRKVYAIAHHYELTQADIADRLLINSGRDEPLILAQTIGGHNLLTPVADQLTEHINANKIDCVIVDPFVSSHQLSENDNVAIDMVVKRWSQVASDSNCAIHLVHHVRKDNGMGGASVADARGASALVDAARFVRRLQRMTADEARNAGIDEDQFWRYTREGDSKNNLSPPSADSTWRKLISIELPNGDSVGVAEPWQWPDAFSDVTRNDLEAVQRKVAAGEYRENARAKDWVGQAVADTMNLDIKDSYVRAKVRHMVSTWIANDALRIVERPDRTRMMRKFVVVGRWVREGEVDE
ncbi:bifunctional DNA primase/polymerase [uncultured Mediterranean phage uvMED]|nr:bifunctional DNA primase/polymerase [uncultured Mediterranean phage uvMED]BAQ90047.1 bifunctional DNA primase/polymerase [uncultured Mediterranean phage uvMED]